MDLRRFLYDFNLASTKTVTSIKEHCIAVNNGRKLPINYENCTSFYDLINEFNNSYQEYLPTLEILKSILNQFGKETRYGYYHQYEDNKSSFAFEAINPNSAIFPEDWAAIYITEFAEKYQAVASNNLPYADSRSKTIKVTSIPQEDITTLMNIISNHHLILEAFAKFKDEFLFGNGTNVIFTKVEGEVFEHLDTFRLTFGNCFFNTTDYIEIKFKLGETLEILYDESKVTLLDQEITDKQEKIQVINEMLQGIYISNSLLPSLYETKKETKKLRKKEQEWKQITK